MLGRRPCLHTLLPEARRGVAASCAAAPQVFASSALCWRAFYLGATLRRGSKQQETSLGSPKEQGERGPCDVRVALVWVREANLLRACLSLLHLLYSGAVACRSGGPHVSVARSPDGAPAGKGWVQGPGASAHQAGGLPRRTCAMQQCMAAASELAVARVCAPLHLRRLGHLRRRFSAPTALGRQLRARHIAHCE